MWAASITTFLDASITFRLYSIPTGCSAVGSAPRLGRGGRRFKSAHPDQRMNRRVNHSAVLGKSPEGGPVEWLRAELMVSSKL